MKSNKCRNKCVCNSMSLLSIFTIFFSFLCFKCIICVEMKPFISVAEEETSKSNNKYQSHLLGNSPRKLIGEIDKSNTTNTTWKEIKMFETSIRSKHTSNSFEKYLMNLLKDHINSNDSMLVVNDTNFPIYLNYDDLLPILIEHMDNQNKNWTDMSREEFPLHDPKYKNEIPGNENYSVSGTITGNGKRKVHLRDIIIQHQSKETVAPSYDGNHISEAQSNISYEQQKYPPWNELSIKEKDYVLRKTQGDPQAYSDWITSTLTIYYSLLLLVGIPGNGLSILIILTNSYMRTPPNIFLLNIAFADFVTLTIVAPVEMRMFYKAYPWQLGEQGCEFVTIICELVTHVLIVTMIAFSLERYFATCHPLKPSLQSGKPRAVTIIVLIWIICLIPSICWSLYSKVEYTFYSTLNDPKTRVTMKDEKHYNDEGFTRIQESAMCVVSPQSVTSFMAIMTILTTVVLYILPILVLPLLYIRIAKALKESENYGERSMTGNNNISRNRKTIVRMQMAVIVCFLICWTPYHVMRIMMVIVTKSNTWTPELIRIREILHIVSGCCYYLNSAINPFLYSLLSKRFRRGFHDLTRKILKLYQKHSFKISSKGAHGQGSNNTPIPNIPSSMIVNHNSSVLINPEEGSNEIPSPAWKRYHVVRSYPNLLHDILTQEDINKSDLEAKKDSKDNINHFRTIKTAESLMNLSSKSKMNEFKYQIRSCDDCQDDEEARILLTYENDEKMKCRYKVMFKTKSNADTKLIINTLNRKKCNSE